MCKSARKKMKIIDLSQHTYLEEQTRILVCQNNDNPYRILFHTDKSLPGSCILDAGDSNRKSTSLALIGGCGQ